VLPVYFWCIFVWDYLYLFNFVYVCGCVVPFVCVGFGVVSVRGVFLCVVCV